MKDHRHMQLPIKEHQIASEYLAVNDHQIASIIQKENILFMFYHIHGTFKLTEYSVYVSSNTCDL
jgi:hypothetical protein